MIRNDFAVVGVRPSQHPTAEPAMTPEHLRATGEGRKGGKPVCKALAQVESGEDLYTPDEVEFMKAMDAYKRDKRRPFPTWSEVLGVLKSLGYKRTRSAKQRIDLMTKAEAIDKIIDAFNCVDSEYPTPRFPEKSTRNQALLALKALGCTDAELSSYPGNDDPTDDNEPTKV